MSWCPVAQARHLSGPAPVQPEHTLSQAAKDKVLVQKITPARFQQLLFSPNRTNKKKKKREKVITCAGVRAFRVMAVLIFLTRGGVRGALVYICKHIRCTAVRSTGGVHTNTPNLAFDCAFTPWRSYRRKLLRRHRPASRPCTHHSPGWSLRCRFCRKSRILNENRFHYSRFSFVCECS